MLVDLNELTTPGFGLPLCLLAPPSADGCNIEKLVDDILIGIVGDLSVRDILNVRLTSKRLSTITRLRAVWHAVFHREVLACGRPVPAIPYISRNITLETGHDDEIRNAQNVLEHRTHLAMRLSKRWAMPRPASSRSFRVNLRDSLDIDIHVSSSEMDVVDDAFLLFGGTRLVTVHRTNVLALWALPVPGIQTTPPLLGARYLAVRHVDVGVDADEDGERCFAILDAAHRSDGYGGEKAEAGTLARMAVPTKDGFFTIVQVSSEEDGASARFHEIAMRRREGELVFLHGHILAHLKSDNSGYLGVELIDWTAPEGASSRALLFEPNTEFGEFLNMCIFTPSNDANSEFSSMHYVVVVWEFNVGVYRLPEALQTCWAEKPGSGTNGECREENGRTILVPPQTVFALHEQVNKPVAFTSCKISHNITPILDESTRSTHRTNVKLSPLTILARPVRRGAGLVQAVLQPIVVSVRQKGHHTDASNEAGLFGCNGQAEDVACGGFEKKVHFRLMRSAPPRSEGPCVALSLGMSGRGVRAELVTGNLTDMSMSGDFSRLKQKIALYRCVPSPVLSPFGLLDSTVDFYPNQAIHAFDIDTVGLNGNERGREIHGQEQRTQIHEAQEPNLDSTNSFGRKLIMRFDEGVGRLIAIKRGMREVSIVDFC